jgi:hypothetical protein
MFTDVSILILWDFMGFWLCCTGFLMDLMGFYEFFDTSHQGLQVYY